MASLSDRIPYWYNYRVIASYPRMEDGDRSSIHKLVMEDIRKDISQLRYDIRFLETKLKHIKQEYYLEKERKLQDKLIKLEEAQIWVGEEPYEISFSSDIDD